EEYGAITDPKLDHGLHVHVGIEDYDVEDIKSLMTWHFEHGREFFNQFPGYQDRRSRKKNYWQWLIDDLQGLTTAEAVWELYNTTSRTGATSSNEFVYRKDVKPARWFESKVEGLDRPLTVEYRAFGSTTDTSLIKE